MSALMSGSNLFLVLAVLPACLPTLSGPQELEADDGWSFFFPLHLQLLGGSVAVGLGTGAGDDLSPPWGCGASPPGCYLLRLCSYRRSAWTTGGRTACCPLAGVQECPHGLGLVQPGVWLLKSHQLMEEGTNPLLKGVVLHEGALTFGWRVGGRAGVCVWVLAGPGAGGSRGGTAEVPYGLRFPCRRIASFTSWPSVSSCCPWRGRGWSHLTGKAHGAGRGLCSEGGASSSSQSNTDPGSPDVTWLWCGLFAL